MSKLTLCAFALLFCGTAADATTYYVGGSSGDDSNAGTTLSTAWATIGKANSTLVAGDTVMLRGGTYTAQPIAPANSGASASLPITYRNYPGETAILSGGPLTQADISNRSWIVIHGLSFTGANWVMAYTSSHCTVENCVFSNLSSPTNTWAGIDVRFNTTYLTIRNCSFDQSPSAVHTIGDQIYHENSSYTLIDSCDFGHSRHYGVNFGKASHHVIVKNCIARNPWHANLGAVGSVGDEPPLANIVYEDNRAFDAGIEESTNPGDTSANNNNLEMQSRDCIIRRNIFDVSADPGSPYSARGMAIASWNFNVTGNRIYNNVISRNPLGCYAEGGSNGYLLQDNVWKNNIFYQNTLRDVFGSTTVASSLFRNNNFYSSVSSQYKGYTGTYAQMAVQFPTEWQNNLGSDPLFMNATGRDFSLQAGSPMIDAGDYLTVTTGSGVNSTLVGVADAKYFCDGFGIDTGDMVQIGGNASVQITAVNYTTNEITLASPITWSTGDSVSLPYLGSRPDIGAFESAALPPVVPIILDNADTAGVVISGTWTTSATGSGYYGSNYIHDGGPGAPRGKSVRFTPTIPDAGTYDVYARWTASANRATNVPIDVRAATGTTTVIVNQRNNNGTWVWLGKFQFNVGTTGNVTIRNDGANGYVVADAIEFVRNKVPATVTLDNLTQIYDGSSKLVTATTSPVGLTVALTYAGSVSPPVNAGSYAVLAFVNDASYTGTSSGTLTINKAPATVSLGSLSQTYDGTQRVVAVTTAPANLDVVVTYDGSANAPSNAGSYAITATIADANHTGSATGTLLVAKAAATIALSNMTQTYDGTAKPVTITTTPVGLAATVTYDGNSNAPTSAGSYTVAASINDPSYTGSATGTLLVAKATATVMLGGLNQTYDDTPRAVTATTSPAGLNVVLTYDGSAAAPTNAGSYAIKAIVNDPNYFGNTSGTLAVAKAPASISLEPLSQSYDGTPRVVTATTAPVGLAVILTYGGSAIAPVGPGSYTVDASVDEPNYIGAASGTLAVTTTALVRHAPSLGGGLDGSIQVLRCENISLSGTAWVSGDLLVPGTPDLRLDGHPIYGGTLEGAGSTAPSDFQVTLNGNAILRHLVQRTDPLALPTVSAPPAPTGTRNVSIQSAGQSIGDPATLRNLTLNGHAGDYAVPAGTYGTFNANGTSGFILGEVGAVTPAVYNLQGLTLDGSARLLIVGPVVLVLAQSGSIDGRATATGDPEWLTLAVASGGLTLNGNASFAGSVIAPAGAVTLNGNATLTGRVVSDRLSINGNGILEQVTP